MGESSSAEKPKTYQLCHGVPILFPRKGCPGSQPKNQTLLLPPLSPVLRTFSYYLSLLHPLLCQHSRPPLSMHKLSARLTPQPATTR